MTECAVCHQAWPWETFLASDWQATPGERTEICRGCTESIRKYWAKQLAEYFLVLYGRAVAA